MLVFFQNSGQKLCVSLDLHALNSLSFASTSLFWHFPCPVPHSDDKPGLFAQSSICHIEVVSAICHTSATSLPPLTYIFLSSPHSPLCPIYGWYSTMVPIIYLISDVSNSDSSILLPIFLALVYKYFRYLSLIAPSVLLIL